MLEVQRGHLTGETPRERSEDLAFLAEVAQHPSSERALAALREYLRLDVAYTTELHADRQVLLEVSGSGASFGLHAGLELPLAQTYCQRVLTGRLPNVIADVRADPRAASLAMTEAADIGAFVSMPLTLSSGQIYGTVCGASHDARPSLGYRELQFLRVLGRLIADQLELGQRTSERA